MSTIEVGKILTTTNTADGVKVSHEYYNAGEKGIKDISIRLYASAFLLLFTAIF